MLASLSGSTNPVEIFSPSGASYHSLDPHELFQASLKSLINGKAGNGIQRYTTRILFICNVDNLLFHLEYLTKV